MEKCIALILARKNSKRLKNKNLIKLNNIPIIEHSINHCLKSKKISSIWVSSDSEKILKLAKKKGVNTILRPNHLCRSKSTSESGWIHAINYIEKKKINFNIIIALQPTSPLRDFRNLDQAITKFKIKKLDSMFSSTQIHDFNTWSVKNKKIYPNYNFKNRKRSQDINDLYLENGSFYIFKKEGIKKYKNRLFGKISHFSISKKYSFQIDDLIDLKIVKALAK